MQRSSRSNRKRLLGLYFFILLLFVLCFVRLIHLMVFNPDNIQDKVTQQWTREISSNPVRGRILDKKGEILAISTVSQSILLYPKQITDAGQVADKLAPILEMDRQKIFDLANDNNKVEVWLKRNITDEQMEKIKELNLKGIGFFTDVKRNNPYGKFASQVIGYTDADGNGKSGIEKAMDTYLKGVNGVVLAQVDAQGRVLDGTELTYIETENGYDVVLTIDAVMQNFAEHIVEDIQNASEAESVTAIVMDPETSKILALAVNPEGDLSDSDRNSHLSSIINNIAINTTIEPGAAFDFVTLGAAFNEGNITYGTAENCEKNYIVIDELVRCWSSDAHGEQDVNSIFTNSCFVGLSKIGLELGSDKFYDYYSAFGFGKGNGIEFAGEVYGTQIIKRNMKETDIAQYSYGKNIKVTPLQLLNAACAAINGGTYHEASIIDHLERPGAEDIVLEKGESYQVISDATSTKIRELFKDNVLNGNSKSSMIDGFEVGANTTVMALDSINSNGEQDKQVVYIGFAPADNPKYAVLILVNKPSAENSYANVIATPYGGELLNKCLQYSGLQPTVDYSDYVEVPDVTGMSIEAAKNKLAEFGLDIVKHGEGEVVAQSPAAGIKVSKSTEIDVYDKNYQEIIDKSVEVPNLVGMSLYEAYQLLKDLGLDLIIEGNNAGGAIATQNPVKNTVVLIGDTITVTCKGS